MKGGFGTLKIKGWIVNMILWTLKMRHWALKTRSGASKLEFRSKKQGCGPGSGAFGLPNEAQEFIKIVQRRVWTLKMRLGPSKCLAGS